MLLPSFSSLCSWEVVAGYGEAAGSPDQHHAHGGDGDAHGGDRDGDPHVGDCDQVN